jgi:hypothetical protein
LLDSIRSRALEPRTLVTACAVVLALACGGEDRAERPAEARPIGAPASEPVRSALTVERGSVRVGFSDGRVSIVSNEAPRLAVLEQLAREVGFRLKLGELEPGPITLQLDATEPHAALAAVLKGAPYAVRYAFDDELEVHVPVRVRVGSKESEEQPPELDEDESYQEEFADEDDWALDEDGQPTQELLYQFDSGDPRLRAEAVAALEPEGAGLDLLLEALETDSDPRVRVAAARQLEDADSFAAVEALLVALGDPDRRVVLAAIDALEFAGDETIIPDLKPLGDHPDDEIATAAREAIEFLE